MVRSFLRKSPFSGLMFTIKISVILLSYFRGLRLFPSLGGATTATLVLGLTFTTITVRVVAQVIAAMALGGRMHNVAALGTGYDFATHSFGPQRPNGQRVLRPYIGWKLRNSANNSRVRSVIVASGPVAGVITSALAIGFRTTGHDLIFHNMLTLFAFMSLGFVIADLLPLSGRAAASAWNATAKGRAASQCKLCAWICKWLCGDDGSEFNRWLWDRSNKLERSTVNQLKMGGKEPDYAHAMKVFEISQTDPETAHGMLIELAEQGSPWATEELAISYETGRGVALDLEQALQWYRRAVDAGSWPATIGYARILTKLGQHDRCDRFLSKNLDKGFVPAHFWLAWFRIKQDDSPKMYREIEPLLEYSANHGHLAAQRFYAIYMMRGKFGLRNIPRGVKLLRKFISGISKDWNARNLDLNENDGRGHVNQGI